MHDYFEVSDIARLIQLSVAPVFLLAGLGGIMMVLSVRMNRFIDRARLLEERLRNISDDGEKEAVKIELESLLARIRMARWSLALSITSELLICALIALLFLGGIFHFDGSFLVATLFVLAMFLVMLGLLVFLREVYLGYNNSRIGLSIPDKENGS